MENEKVLAYKDKIITKGCWTYIENFGINKNTVILIRSLSTSIVIQSLSWQIDFAQVDVLQFKLIIFIFVKIKSGDATNNSRHIFLD